MEYLKMHTSDKTNSNIQKIGELFPNCITERLDKNGQLEMAIDFDMLRQELSKEMIEGPQERYQFVWPDKSKAIRLANIPTSLTVRPYMAESEDFDNTQNLYIEGDNLEVLKLLQETYLEKIDVIYIDPPYNTGNSLVYHNDFFENNNDYLLSMSGQYDENGNLLVCNTENNGRFHTDWLNMMYPRLKIAKNLLKKSGILVLTIDDYEVNTITTVLNEIFGEHNHLATVVIKNNHSARSTINGFSINHEYALYYSKSNDVELGRMRHTKEQKQRYKENDDFGSFEWENFRKNGTDSDRNDRPKQYFPIIINEKNCKLRIPTLCWKDKEYEVLDELTENEKLVFPVTQNGQEKVWKYGIERTKEIIDEIKVKKNGDFGYELYRKKYLNDEGVMPHTWWDKPEYSARDNGTRMLTNIFGPTKIFDFPKAPEAVKDSLLTANLKSGGIVLDFFSGSATTAHAVMQLNAEDGGKRKFIMVQLPEKTEENSEAYKAGYKNICEIGKERIRRAGKKIKEENPLTTQDLDTGFRVLKLDTSNMEDVYYKPEEFSDLRLFEDNVKPDRTPEDLLFQVMLECNLPLSAKIEKKTIAGKEVFNVNEGYLIACFDKDVNEQVITEVAKQQPYYFIMRDSSLSSDNVADNFEQIFNAYSKDTIRKIL